MNITILHGGKSSESADSTQNALCVEKALIKRGHDVVLLEFTADVIQRLQAAKPDIVFIAVQGGRGDGTAQALCECLAIPYTGMRARAAAVASDKTVCKEIVVYHGIPTPGFQPLKHAAWSTMPQKYIMAALQSRLRFPLVVKTNVRTGDSGAAFAFLETPEQIHKVDAVFRHGSEVLFEEFVGGQFLAVSLIETEDGPLILPAASAGPTDRHDDPLLAMNRPRTIVPADLSPDQLLEIAEVGARLFDMFNCRGYARIDFIVDEVTGLLNFIELNAAPELTAQSFLPFSARLHGLDLDEVCERIVENGIKAASKG